MNKKRNKKAVSQVVGTVMLIALTIMAIAIISSILIPMVRNMLEGGASCFEARDQVKILSSKKYSCYNNSGSGETRVMVKRDLENISIGGIILGNIETSSGSADSFKITKNNGGGIKMLNSTGGIEDARLLDPGEARTYIIPNHASKTASVSVTTRGKTCDEQSYNLPRCN